MYKKSLFITRIFFNSGAQGETRTLKVLPPVDFESTASTSSATRALSAAIIKDFRKDASGFSGDDAPFYLRGIGEFAARLVRLRHFGCYRDII